MTLLVFDHFFDDEVKRPASDSCIMYDPTFSTFSRKLNGEKTSIFALSEKIQGHFWALAQNSRHALVFRGVSKYYRLRLNLESSDHGGFFMYLSSGQAKLFGII